ncbi:MAG: undecaprenyl diphosphate synthase family protein [Cellulosilyticaceae bacterium]
MRIPKHIGIIPDGNRRWAQAEGLGKSQGYTHGLDPGLALLRLAKDTGIKEITYYGFTTDNCKRPKEQFEAFSKACVDAVKLIEKEDVSLLVLGNTDTPMFPTELLPYTTRTNPDKDYIKVNFLVNYGWDWDLGNLSPTTRRRHDILESLHSKDISRIDLVIRWGGRNRLSGFLPVQSVYADFYTLDALWPEFTPAHFTQALEWYHHQDVTLGG